MLLEQIIQLCDPNVGTTKQSAMGQWPMGESWNCFQVILVRNQGDNMFGKANKRRHVSSIVESVYRWCIIPIFNMKMLSKNLHAMYCKGIYIPIKVIIIFLQCCHVSIICWLRHLNDMHKLHSSTSEDELELYLRV